MNALVTIAIIGPIIGSAIGLAVRREPRLRDISTLIGLGAAAASALAILFTVVAEGTHVVRVGGWGPELGIVLVADLFAALVLPVALVIIFVVELFAIGQRRTDWGANPEVAGPLLGVLTSGVALAMLTGDLFTLFVAFELILVSSYVLLTHQGQRAQVGSGMTYVVMNLLASTLFLFGLAFVYSATGTVNLRLTRRANSSASRWCTPRDRRLVLYRLWNQGCDLPALFVAPRLLSHCANDHHRGLRGVANQDWHLRHDSLPHAYGDG